QRAADEILERLHDALDVLRLLDEADGELFERLLATVKRRGEIVLRRAEHVGGRAQYLCVVVEARRDGRDVLERRGRQVGEAAGIGVDEARRAGEGLGRPLCA